VPLCALTVPSEEHAQHKQYEHTTRDPDVEPMRLVQNDTRCKTTPSRAAKAAVPYPMVATWTLVSVTVWNNPQEQLAAK
jgi:hypothetical protein